MVRDREQVYMEHLLETGVGFSDSAIILVAMATCVGETLNRSSRDADKSPDCAK